MKLCHLNIYIIYPILDILPVVFFHVVSVRYSMIFHSAFPVEYRINHLLHSFLVRYYETFHSLRLVKSLVISHASWCNKYYIYMSICNVKYVCN